MSFAPHHSVFDFGTHHCLSRPLRLADGTQAYCFYLGGGQHHALILRLDTQGMCATEFLLDYDAFMRLHHSGRHSDVLQQLATHAISRVPPNNRMPSTGTDAFESPDSRATRQQRRSLLDQINAQLPQPDSAAELDDSQLQNAQEAALYRRLSDAQGQVQTEQVERLLEQAKTPLDEPGPLSPIQSSIIEIPQVLRSATILSYVRMQIPNDKGGMASLSAPISLLRFDAVLLNGALFREEINFKVELGRYIETYRKLVIKQTAFGFGLSIGLGAVPPPPENTTETKEGDPRFEKGQEAKEGGASTPDKDEGDQQNNGAEKGLAGAGIGASFSAEMIMKKHKLIERATDDYVASITPIARFTERLA